MFASKITSTVTITDADLGEIVVTIRALSWKTLEKARELRTDWAVKRQSALPVPVLEAMAKRHEAAAEAKLDAPPAWPPSHPYGEFDRDTVIRAGVKSWTADDKLPAALEDLQEDAADRLHKAILDLSLPSLEPGAEETARKNA